MKIGVVSDTHSLPMPKQMLADFKSVDFIIHAGDFCDEEDYEVLAKIKEVKGVYGNMDNDTIRSRFPRRQIIECGLVKIGVFHGEGSQAAVLASVQSEFAKDLPNLVIFGHSHQPFHEQIGNTIFFNPGSPNDMMFAPYFSYGMVEIQAKKIVARIIKIRG